MTYNVFSGTLNPTQSINSGVKKDVIFRGRHQYGELSSVI